MRKIFSIVICALITPLSVKSFAGRRECDWARQVNRDEGWRINHRNEEIGRRNQLIVEQQRELEKHAPIAEAWNHNLAIHQQSLNSLKTARETIDAVIDYVRTAIVTDKVLRHRIELIQEDLRKPSDLKLSHRIRQTIISGQLPQETAEKLQQLAIAIETLESDAIEWKKLEIEILSGQTSTAGGLIDDLYVKLVQCRQRLSADLQNQEQGRARDQEQTDLANNRVKSNQDRISELNGEIAQLQAENAKSLEYMRTWSVDDHCPRPSMEPRVPIREWTIRH